MKSILPLALVVSAVASLAWAASPAQDAPLERLGVVEKELAALKERLARLEQGGAGTELARGIQQDRERHEALLAWARAQGDAAKAFQDVLNDARDKGFTAGINPASREALLAGFDALAASLRKSASPATPQSAPQAPRGNVRRGSEGK